MRRPITVPTSVRIVVALYVGWVAITAAIAVSWRHWLFSFGLLALVHAIAWFLELRLETKPHA